jgi:hypothetical protein
MARRRNMTASMKIALSDPNALLRVHSVKAKRDWAKAWNYYDNIGEVHFALNEVGREMSRVRLVAQKFGPDGWEDVEENDKAQLLVDGLQSYAGGQPGFLRSYYINQKVVGETLMVVYEKEGQTWVDMCSPDEVDVQEGTSGGVGNKLVRRMLPSRDTGISETVVTEELVGDVDVIRFWNPHPRWSMAADSPLLAMDVVLEELQVLTRSLLNKLSSRLAINGFWFIPNEITEAGTTSAMQGDPTGLHQDPLVNKLVKAMTEGMLDQVGPGAAMPFLLRGPATAGDAIRIEFPDRELFSAEIELRNELIERTFNGLDIHRETAKGVGDSNHWSSWSSQELHLNNQLSPEVESLCVGLNKDWYGDVLEQNGLDRASYRVWHCMDALTQRPNKAEDARQVADRAGISPVGLRAASGIDEEFAPTDEEYIRQAGLVCRNVYFALWEMPGIEDDDFVKAGVTKPSGPAPGPGEQGPAGPGVGDPGSPDNQTPDAPNRGREGGRS